ncbi:zinc finger protein 234-like isoform X2 [Cylas formicarius]|uniref:zinc finger protein 234-like isoform X2 n=1 Tax=Cylas formicarius TaxID=197179 RepID=UPI0029583233|nr:zinc finger protein 234-like isoform X2 [Cylas formicarius]
MDVDRVDLSLICRTCKCVSPQMRSVFQGVEHPNQNPRIDEMLMACAAVQVAYDDGLPSLMCEMCVQSLRSAFIFKKQCESVDTSLREYSKTLKVNAIKQELQNSEFMESLNTLNNLLNTETQQGTIKENSDSSNLNNDTETAETCQQAKASSTDTDYIQFLDNNQMLLTCRECAKIFTTIEGLRCHKRVHAGNTFKCKQCDKEYTRLNHLQRHEASHGKRKVHVCKICNKTLTRMEHLKRHLVTHLREKPFNCKTCNRGFNRIEHLHNHVPRCKGENVHICNICNKAFNREDSLEVHKQVHGNTQFALPTIENLDNIDEHYFQVDFDENADFSDHSDIEDCFEPQIEVTENIEETKIKDFGDEIIDDVDGGHSIGDDSSSQGSAADNDLSGDIKEDEDDDDKPEGDEKIVSDHLLLKYEDKSECNEEDNTLARKAIGHDLDVDAEGIDSSAESSDSEYLPLKKLASPKTGRRRGRPRKYPPKIKVPGRRGRPALKARKKEEEEEIGDFPCPACGEMFDRMSLLDKHARIKHQGIKIYKCHVCLKDFSRPNHLKRHLTSHSESKPYECDICKKSFNRRDHLTQHQKLHERQQQYSCDVCQRPFTRADHLAKHKASKHGIGDKVGVMGQKKFICDVCHKGFTTEKYRDVHMKAHNGEKKYQCKTCEKTFLSKSHLTEHMKFHNEHSKKFLCSECGQRFIRNDYLVIHMRRHRGEKPFKCKFCGKGFPRTTDLTVHERYHTGEKTHLCTVCGRGFGRAYNLTVHMRTHTGEKPYQCTYCDAAFAQGNDLKAHVRRHTGERFQCELCTESFLMGYLLTQHKRTVHGLNVVSNIRRLQPIHKQENPDEPPPITIPLPKPVVPESLMFNHIQAQLAVAQMHLARE